MLEIPQDKWYNSQKGWFGGILYNEMIKNPNIIVIVGDLGYGLFDKIKQDFPDRFINTGAAEQAMMGIAIGLALEGKIPFVFSITNFLLYRPYEWVRNYIDYESIPVKMIASGRDDEYKEDGITHQSCDAKDVLNLMPNIVSYWPETKEEIQGIVTEMIENKKPCFLSMRRKA